MRSIMAPGIVWDKIAKALPFSGGTWNLMSLQVGVAAGNIDVIESGESVLVAETVEYPTGLRAYRAVAGSGSWKDVDGMMERLLSGAKRAGASRIEIYGRKGWARKLDKIGFKTMFTVFHREV